ncbi:hypothetical protein AAH991_39900, partial [Microbispora sp. ZYX-F-249]
GFIPPCRERGVDYNQRQPVVRPRSRRIVPPKNLLGIPWRVAFALQQDGWILRNAIVRSKPNAMPQSALDRLSTRYELIFLVKNCASTGSTSTPSASNTPATARCPAALGTAG